MDPNSQLVQVVAVGEWRNCRTVYSPSRVTTVPPKIVTVTRALCLAIENLCNIVLFYFTNQHFVGFNSLSYGRSISKLMTSDKWINTPALQLCGIFLATLDSFLLCEADWIQQEQEKWYPWEHICKSCENSSIQPWRSSFVTIWIGLLCLPKFDSLSCMLKLIPISADELSKKWS